MKLWEKYVGLIRSLKRSSLITSKEVEEAFLAFPRYEFVLERYRDAACEDTPVPTLDGQTVSQPSIVAYMIRMLDLRRGQKVLEIGTGSGWNACLMARLVYPGEVISIEINPRLAEFARKNVEKFGVPNVRIVVADGSCGYESEAPYDRIVATAAYPRVPLELVEQLNEGGKLLAPEGELSFQHLVLIEKKREGVRRRVLIPCIFVPMHGRCGFSKEYSFP